MIDDFIVEKEGNKCFVYINGRMVDIEQLSLSQMLKGNIDKEFSTEIMNLVAKVPEKISRQAIKLEAKLDMYINTIDEFNKKVYGIKVGKTTRMEAYSILKNILKKNTNFDPASQYVSFSEKGIALNFNNDNDIVDEIILTSPFEGSTTLGLRIGLSMENACKLCGEPKFRSIVTAFWNNFSVNIKNGRITSIRIN